MDKKSKKDGASQQATVERLDAYVSVGTKQGLSVWGNRLTWQSLFGYVPHFVEQLNTHRGVLEFLGGTFRDKKNSKLINPPQAFFSHQMDQMRATQVSLSQDVQSLTIRLQEEQSRREGAERRVADLEAQLESFKGALFGSNASTMAHHHHHQQQGGGYGGYEQQQGYGGGAVLRPQDMGNVDPAMFKLPHMETLASKTSEIRAMAANLLAQTNPGPANPNAANQNDIAAGSTFGLSAQLEQQCSEADQYLRLLARGGSDEVGTSGSIPRRLSGGLEAAGPSEAPSVDDPILQQLRVTLANVGPSGSLLTGEPLLGLHSSVPMPHNPFAGAAVAGGAGGGGEQHNTTAGTTTNATSLAVQEEDGADKSVVLGDGPVVVGAKRARPEGGLAEGPRTAPATVAMGAQ